MDNVLCQFPDFINLTPVFLRFFVLRQPINPPVFPSVVSYEIKLFSLHLLNCFQYLQSSLKLSIKEQLISLSFSFSSLYSVTFETCQHPVDFSLNNKVTLYLPPSSFRLNSDVIYVIFT